MKKLQINIPKDRGNDGVWCRVYTSCPLNKGKEHDMKRVCITVKKGHPPLKHCYIYTGLGNQKRCTYCWDIEEGQ